MSIEREMNKVKLNARRIIGLKAEEFYPVLKAYGNEIVEYAKENPNFLDEIVEKCRTKDRATTLLNYIFQRAPILINQTSEKTLMSKSAVLAIVQSISFSGYHDGFKVLKRVPECVKKDIDIIVGTVTSVRETGANLDEIIADLGVEWQYKTGDCVDVLRANNDCIKYVDKKLKTNYLFANAISKKALKEYYSKEEILTVASIFKGDIDEFVEVFADDKEILEALLKNNVLRIKQAYKINKQLLEDELFYDLILRSVTYNNGIEYIDDFQKNFIKKSYRLDPEKLLFLYSCENLELKDEILTKDIREYLGEEDFLKLILNKPELLPMVKSKSLDIEEEKVIELIKELDSELAMHLFLNQKKRTAKIMLAASLKNPECVYFIPKEMRKHYENIILGDMGNIKDISKEELALTIQILKYHLNYNVDSEVDKKDLIDKISNNSR